MTEAATEAATEVDWRLWGTFIVSLVSLIWNLCNTIYTTRSANRLRGQTVRLDEFRKTIRDPIVTAFVDCEAIGTRADAIAISAQPLEKLSDEISALNREAIAAIAALSDRLGDADRSSFAPSNTWLEGHGTLEDNIYNLFNCAANTVVSEQARRDALKKVKSEFRDYRAVKNAELEESIRIISGSIK